MITVSLEKPNCTQGTLVTNVGLSWRLFPFILFNVTVVRAAEQLHITSLPPQPLTDFIVFLELMASPFHLQIYHWSMWPNWGTYRKTDAVQTLSFRLPAAGLKRKQTESSSSGHLSTNVTASTKLTVLNKLSKIPFALFMTKATVGQNNNSTVNVRVLLSMDSEN